MQIELDIDTVVGIVKQDLLETYDSALYTKSNSAFKEDHDMAKAVKKAVEVLADYYGFTEELKEVKKEFKK